MKSDTPSFDDYDDGQYSNTYDTSTPKSPPSCVLMPTRNGSSHWIDHDGDPYDSNFERDFDDFYEQYLDDTSTSIEEYKMYHPDLKCKYYKNLSSKNSHAENKYYTLK